MKISKLFHWLYGILMLLPCFAILVKCAYVAFNKNAYESYSGTSTQYVQKTLQTNEVNSVNDLIIGNVYKLSYYKTNLGAWFYNYYNDSLDGIVFITFDEVLSSQTSDYSFESDNYFLYFNNNDIEVELLQVDTNYHFDYYVMLSLDNLGNYYAFELSTNQISDDFAIIKITGTYDYSSFYQFFEKCPQEYLQYTTYYEEVEVSTLDNVFYYAVDEVCNNELFAWASNSFLNAPLTYITNLFNMPTDNAVILLMSYWFNISIIWLCFDVMIYVPLLVHRWLDKGIVE